MENGGHKFTSVLLLQYHPYRVDYITLIGNGFHCT